MEEEFQLDGGPASFVLTVAGIDEAGRGPLAGPVVAAVVMLAVGQSIPGVRDSKQMSAASRSAIALQIRAEAIDWAIGMADHGEIDAINILNATMLAMGRAFAGLTRLPSLVQVDGNRTPDLGGFAGRVEAVVGGDRLCHAVSAASILAKVHRDDIMQALHIDYPGYGFDQHKGYPTAEHRAALLRLGPCPVHRRSFGPVRVALAAVPSGHGRAAG